MPISRRHLLVALGLALPGTAGLIAPASAATTDPQLPHRPAHPARPHASHAPAKATHAKRTGQQRSHAATTHRRRRPQTPA